MPVSDVSIANMALMRAGAKGDLVSFDDDTDKARAVSTFYEVIRDEVLAEVKPKFATKRVALQQNTTAPLNGYQFAYVLPADFLCRVDDRKGRPALAPEGFANGFGINGNFMLYYQGSYVPGLSSFNMSTWMPYEIERTSDDVLCICCDFNNTDTALYLTYIMRVTDPSWFSPMFANAFIDRLAGECALAITDAGRYQGLMQKYELSKKAAKAEALAQDSLTDETGNSDWEKAGR